MSRLIVRRVLFVSMVTLLAIGLVGCGGPKVSGKYVSDGNTMTVEFKSGQATLSDILGNSETSDYTVSGSTITVKSKQRGDLQFAIMQDGSISGQGIVLKKAAD